MNNLESSSTVHKKTITDAIIPDSNLQTCLGIFPSTSVSSSHRAGLKIKRWSLIALESVDICQMVQMEIWWKRSEIALLSTMTMKLISIFKLNSQARYHGLQLSTGTFFSLEFSLNVSSALKVNASIKLKLTTLYEDIIKWMSFVTIIVLQQLFRTAWHAVVHTAWAQLCPLWNSFSSLMIGISYYIDHATNDCLLKS